jgi:hypothetical protein
LQPENAWCYSLLPGFAVRVTASRGFNLGFFLHDTVASISFLAPGKVNQARPRFFPRQCRASLPGVTHGSSIPVAECLLSFFPGLDMKFIDLHASVTCDDDDVLGLAVIPRDHLDPRWHRAVFTINDLRDLATAFT